MGFLGCSGGCLPHRPTGEHGDEQGHQSSAQERLDDGELLGGLGERVDVAVAQGGERDATQVVSTRSENIPNNFCIPAVIIHLIFQLI